MKMFERGDESSGYITDVILDCSFICWKRVICNYQNLHVC